MFFVVEIQNSRVKLIVPVQWIHNLNVSRIFNYGVNKKKLFLMFYSNDAKTDPEFSLEIFSDVKESNFCFYGRILKGFGKIIFFVYDS